MGLSQRFDACYASLKQEQRERSAAIEELSERVIGLRKHFMDESSQTSLGYRDLRETMDKDRVNLDQLASRMDVVRDLQMQMQEIQQERHEHGAAIREARAHADKHTQAYEKLTRNVGQLSDTVADNVLQKLKESPGMTPEGYDAELQAIRKAIREATQELQESIKQERHSRQESNT